MGGLFRPAALPLALAAGYLLQLLGVLLVLTPCVLAGAVLGVGLEAALLGRRCGGVARRLARLQFSRPVRQLLRDALLLGGLLRVDALRPPGAGAWLLVALLACWATHFGCQGVAGRVRRSRRLPFVTRNIDTDGLRLGHAPPRLFGGQGTARLVAVAAVVTAGTVVTAATGRAWWAAGAATACCAALCAGTLLLGLRLLPSRRPVGEAEALEWLEDWLTAYAPTVGLYFSGGASSAYQANMWLSTLARLEGRPLIVLRERFMVRKIAATDVPVLCVPKVAHLMQLESSGLAVLLHPANSGKTSQVLRIPTIKHAFINHGESDKLSSCNPYAKAYDQVWVAGPAARERYRLADVGVDDADVVEVGRPQLAPIRAGSGPPPDGRITVLYAPTWEGWTDDPGNTSVVLAGERLVRTLLADGRVRLLYKPHPMTGSVDPAAGAADRRIRALVTEAAARTAEGPVAGPGELARAEAALHGLTEPGFRPGADEAERMLLQSAPPADRASRVERATAAWEQAYWDAAPARQHRVVAGPPGPHPSVYSCFNQADALVSDVSSVVSDWLAGEKPYAVVNTSGLAEDDFRAAFPTAGAATVLSPSAAEVPAFLAAVRDPASDTLAGARAALKVRLLGPAEPPSLERFDRAALALRAEAEAHRSRSPQAAEAGREEARAVAAADSEAERAESDPEPDAEPGPDAGHTAAGPAASDGPGHEVP
ncbi:hypothetical protein [Streptomyces sp. HNM0574]|uniref:hypothetical protein n=1 Tax=Streptomyces sp. HNM0574 TaxID=2714954 RepID=UPI001F0E7381|nr:hypothetical protein [Streptomyces sp. HNM0574]